MESVMGDFFGIEKLEGKSALLKPGDVIQVKRGNYEPLTTEFAEFYDDGSGFGGILYGLEHSGGDSRKPVLPIIRTAEGEKKFENRLNSVKEQEQQQNERTTNEHQRTLELNRRASFFHDGGMHDPRQSFMRSGPRWINPSVVVAEDSKFEVIDPHKPDSERSQSASLAPGDIAVRLVSGSLMIQPGSEPNYEQAELTPIEDIETINGVPAMEFVNNHFFIIKKGDLKLLRKKGKIK
jgi:hypothetical protein